MSNFTKLKACLVSGLMLLGVGIEAQTAYYPFPQNKTYLGGLKPTNAGATAMSDAALAAYNKWKTDFVTATGACGYRRVKFDFYSGGLGKTDGSTTVSEGIAYGMLLSAYAADASLFSDLWNYYKKNVNQNGVMHWKIENCGVVGANGASDAELDVAMALVVASYQWQSDAYLQDAKKMIALIRTKEFEGSILKPGDMFGGSNLVNPSYFSPAYYRIFANLDAGQAAFWNAAVTKGYDIIKLAEKNNNGLVPDWCDANGNFSSGASGYTDQGKSFFFDAIRTPFRSAIDVLWHGGTTAAKGMEYCTRLTNFIISKHGLSTSGTGSKYDLAGNVLQAYHNNCFAGCFAVAGMASSGGTNNFQTFVNNAWTDNNNTNPGYGEYFNASFKAMALFVMSGNFYNPTAANCTAANLGANVSLCKGSPVTLNSGITGATSYTWSFNGATINNSASTYNATQPGNYQVIVNQSGCITRSNILVDQATMSADFTYSIQGINVLLTNTSVGASDYKWEYSTAAAPTTFILIGTTRDISTQFATAGNYNIRLTIDKTGYGCTSSPISITKKVAVGNGAGWVIDDFNEHKIGDAWVPNGSANYTALPMTYCSAADEIAVPNPGKKCPNNPCGFLQVNCLAGAGAQYQPFGVTINDTTGTKANLDISTVPYVAVRIRASAAVNIGVGVNADVSKTGCPACTTSTNVMGSATTARQFVQLAANKDTIVYLDFSLAASQKGYFNDKNTNVALDFTKVHGVEFYPYEKVATYTGTITVDWIIVGGKSLTPPQFNLKRDAKGYLVYEDPDGDKVYTPVPDWSRKVKACAATATITANACTATSIQWFRNGALVSTGATATGLTPGKYIVNLINAGGVTKDSVEIIGSTLAADFTMERTNYDVHFNNASASGYTGFTWAYGDVANDLPGSTKWDVGYHNYKKASTTLPATYTVSLTITDSICKTSNVKTQQLVIKCDSLVKTPVLTVSDSTGCEGKIIDVAVKTDANANFYGFYGPAGTTFAANTTTTDTLDRKVTFGNLSGPLTIKVGNDCGEKQKIVKLDITPKPTSDFTATNTSGSLFDFVAAYASTPAATYAWTFGDPNSSTGTGKATSFTYPQATADYNVGLTVNNTCGTSTVTTKKVSVLFTDFEELSATSGVRIYPTTASTSLNVELDGTANLTITNAVGLMLSKETVTTKGAIDVSSLQAGVYFVTVSKDGKSFVTRFIKQ